MLLRRGSLELSANALVVVILGAILLALGVYLVTQWVCSVQQGI